MAKDGLDEKLARMRSLRGYLLSQAEALAAAGALKRSDVARIRAGTGGDEAAKDLQSLGALFAGAQAQVRGKTRTRAQLDEATALGAEMLATLSPTSAPT